MRKGEIAIIIFGIVVVVVVVVWLIISSNSSSSSSSSSSGGSGGGSGTSNLGDNCLKNDDCRSTVCGGGKCVPSPGASCKQTLGDCTSNIPYKDFFCNIAGPVRSILVDGYSTSNLPSKSVIVAFKLKNSNGATGCTGTIIVDENGPSGLKIGNGGSGYTSHGNTIEFVNLPGNLVITVYPEDLSVEVDGKGATGKCVKY